MKSTKICEKRGRKQEGLRKENRMGEFDQSALYAYMETPQ
jgi:hypothetical protein